ncbi:MAG: hypothetical protein HYZ85_03650 [Candidatus Omnitrophica bacterium]|nr:hypothetical protein [Candidatus Omnitrophota bacterium]
MKNEYLKTLWVLRFEKQRKNEEEAAWKYQELYDQCVQGLGVEDEAVKLLQQLSKEERQHAGLTDELIHIAQRNHPEIGIM